MVLSSKSGALTIGLCSALALGHAERASAAPDEDKTRAAAAFEAGAAAFKAKNYEEAAKQFEEADSAVATAKSLRLALRARSEAGDKAQAASLAALALSLYPSDDEIGKLAHDTVGKLGRELEAVNVTCAAPCTLATTAHAVHGGAARSWTVFVEPGAVSVTATFGDKSAPPQSLKATAGGATSLSFDAPEAPRAPKADGDGGASAGSHDDSGRSSSSEHASGSSSDSGSSSGDTPPPETAPKKPWGIHPAVFGVGLGVTAVLGATTIWSGVDAQNNPGPDAVKKQCAGVGTSCQAYQDGLAAQRRTNILIGVTAGTAAVTVVLAIVTNWHGSPKTDAPPPSADPEKPAQARRPALAIADPRLWLDLESAKPKRDDDPRARASSLGAVAAPDGVVCGVSGRF